MLGISIKTPDGNTFQMAVINEAQTDSLEKLYSHHLLDDTLLNLNQRPAYQLPKGEILYRQFYEGPGFWFPSLDDYKRAVRGRTYAETNIQIDENNKVLVSFLLLPKCGNQFLEEVQSPLTGYESFEGREFYQLRDNSVIMIRRRTPELTDGYWFASLRDFDHFYYIFSGKEKNLL